MSEQPGKSANTPTQRGAELVGLIVDSLELTRIILINELRLHVMTEVIMQEMTGGSPNRVTELKREKRRYEEENAKANEDFDQDLRRLMAIKLSSEGKTSEEIIARFAEEDEAMKNFRANSRQL